MGPEHTHGAQEVAARGAAPGALLTTVPTHKRPMWLTPVLLALKRLREQLDPAAASSRGLLFKSLSLFCKKKSVRGTGPASSSEKPCPRALLEEVGKPCGNGPGCAEHPCSFPGLPHSTDTHKTSSLRAQVPASHHHPPLGPIPAWGHPRSSRMPCRRFLGPGPHSPLGTLLLPPPSSAWPSLPASFLLSNPSLSPARR